ncbi:MAG: helix-turn-helix domain-containing protein, partial [Actinomycetota bacterium]
MNAQEIGLALAKARIAAGMSQADLASKMDTTQSAVSRAESGAVTPSIDFIDRAARATGRPI